MTIWYSDHGIYIMESSLSHFEMGLTRARAAHQPSAVSPTLTKANARKTQHATAHDAGSETIGVANAAVSGMPAFLTLPWKLWSNKFAILGVEHCTDQIPDVSPDHAEPDTHMPGPDLSATTSSTFLQQTTKRSLLTLPLELRRIIYTYLLPTGNIGTGSIHMSKDDVDEEKFWFVSLIRTCAQVHDELAQLVYQQVSIHNSGDSHSTAELLRVIGSNVRHIQSVQIQYVAHGSFFGQGARFPLRPWDKNKARFPFIEALRLLEAEATSLRMIHVNMEAFSSEARRGACLHEQDHEDVIRNVAPEVMYTLKELAHFTNVERIIIGDEAGEQHFWDPVVLYYLRGQLSFDLLKASGTGTRWRDDWTDPKRPSLVEEEVKMEYSVLVNPRWEEERENSFVAEFREQDYGRDWMERISRRWARHTVAQKAAQKTGR